MFLARYQVEVPLKAKSTPKAPSEALEAEAPHLAPMPYTTKARSQRISEQAPAASEETPMPEAAPSVAEETPVSETPVVEAAPKPAPVSEAPKGPKVENVALFTDAIRFLRRRGDSLAETAATLGEGSASGLIAHCVSAVEHLVDQFTDDDSGCDAADAFIDELAEAQDMMVLMQVEDGDGPAADAVTLLLQLRRDMEMQLAA